MTLLEKYKTPCPGMCPSPLCPLCVKAFRLVGYSHELYMAETDFQRFKADYFEYKSLDKLGNFTVDSRAYGEEEKDNYYYCTSLDEMSEEYLKSLFPYVVKFKLNSPVER